VVAITHQSMEDDIQLARQIPGLALIMGGHEHERQYAAIGDVIITKADANARSAYKISLRINTRTHTHKVNTKLIIVNEKIDADSATDAVVGRWTDIADRNYASLGFDARKEVMHNGEPLDGRESMIRTTTTNFTKLIVSSMQQAAPNADVVIINSGSIRVDDILQMPVTQYDIIRSLPFGGSIMEVDMKGRLLVKILEAGRNNRGIGGFLHYSQNLTNDAAGHWVLKNIPVDPEKVYKVAITDFLMTGGEANMDFLKKDNPDIVKVYPVFTDLADPRSDIRLAIIRYMEKL
jgi:2',3'-cyclic-nucleotide 2'-phosphodiesterase (5'-nucleotidase family)